MEQMATISFSFASPSKTLNPSSISPQNPTFFHLCNPQHLKTTLSPQPLFLKSTPPISHLFIRSLKTPQCRISSTPITSLFTGIVEEMGQIKQLGYTQPDSFSMIIQAKLILDDINLGDSISVNGTCLTVADFDAQKLEFSVGLAPETLRKTSLIELEKGSLVNLERALRPSTRMGGHFVQGHVDGTGEIVELKPEGDSLWVKVKTGKELLRYIVPKGFIAVDGTSLTVVDVSDEEECFNFMLVAYTQQNVVIPMKKVGQKVNLEVDILGKYVERLLSSGFVDSIKSS
ncbi:riboflavin synthase-like [Lycium barbarum]|uniref:riboflavin synthase-like n=1 Tax=Lycium barbarum TaxID=112863 RepID=UPI00293E484F|nr:riboflavin synthase-like [Lycium barbarum]XP_060188232.1 riboflavin synthase-like [Lycium barbarum]